jgi:hypothetical protein
MIHSKYRLCKCLATGSSNDTYVSGKSFELVIDMVICDNHKVLPLKITTTRRGGKTAAIEIDPHFLF